MADEIDTAIKSGFAAFGFIGAAFITGLFNRRPKDRDAQAVRNEMDRTQAAILADVRADLERERRKSELWERRARRVDEVANHNNHIVAPFIMNGTVPGDRYRSIPFLEDPF